MIVDKYPEIREITVAADYTKYEDFEAWKEKNRQLIMNEIKRKDEKFYAKWCDNETQCR